MPRARSSAAGFSLIELLIATGIFLTVFAVVTQGLVQMNLAQRTIWNRTEMHGGIRSATELLQQEIGQAGRIALPGTATLSSAVVGTGDRTVGMRVNGAASASGVFVGEWLTVDAGPNQETVQVKAVDQGAKTFTAFFGYPAGHAAGAPVNALGAFAAGIIPTTLTSGSTGSRLKLVGDVNDDGKMLYVEYVCDTTTQRNLYRNPMAWDTASTLKPAAGPSQVLLSNVLPNPDGTPCFTYQQVTIGTDTYVTGVAITLTVQTLEKDPITRQYQMETKALLNVSPRNVVNAAQYASLGATQRIQPLPPPTLQLLP